MGTFDPGARGIDAVGKTVALMPDLALFVIGVLVTIVVAFAVGLIGLSDLDDEEGAPPEIGS